MAEAVNVPGSVLSDGASENEPLGVRRRHFPDRSAASFSDAVAFSTRDRTAPERCGGISITAALAMASDSPADQAASGGAGHHAFSAAVVRRYRRTSAGISPHPSRGPDRGWILPDLPSS